MKNLHRLFLPFLMIATPLCIASAENNNDIELTKTSSDHTLFKTVSAVMYGVNAIGMVGIMVTAIGTMIQDPYKIRGPVLQTLIMALPLLYFRTAYELAKKDEAVEEKYQELLKKYNKLKST